MSTVIEVSYFNTFLLKRAIGSLFETNSGSSSVSVKVNSEAVWPSLPWVPEGYPCFGVDMNKKNVAPPEYNWYAEEARIRGGYNNTQTELGPKAYAAVEIKDEQVLNSSIIYSGIFNSTTQINETNVFSIAEDIRKDVDPRYGSIQKIFASNTNLDILQENKCSRGLIDKDAIYSASGGGSLTTSEVVIGQVTPYNGDYGISKNPESFAHFGTRRYFTDAYRGKVLRLTYDGLTEISNYGMKDFFRDKLGSLREQLSLYNVSVILQAGSGYVVTAEGEGVELLENGMTLQSFPNSPIIVDLTAYSGSGANSTVSITLNNQIDVLVDDEVTFSSFRKDSVVGGFDNYADEYLLSIQPANPNDEVGEYKTLAYDETVRGWVSFYTYKPTIIQSFKRNLYTSNNTDLYQHYFPTANRSYFYGEQYNSSIVFVFNPQPSIMKNFKTVSYEGSNGWQVDYFRSYYTGPDLYSTNWEETRDTSASVKSFTEGLYIDNQGYNLRVGFNRKENVYMSNLINNSNVAYEEITYGSDMAGIKGFTAEVKLSTDESTQLGGVKELFSASSKFIRTNQIN